MIEEPPILTVKENQNRLPSDVIDQLRLYPTGFIVDAMDGSGAISHEIKAIGAPALSPKMCGSVLTCQCSPADNLGLLAALDEIQSGDVLVVATGPWTGCAAVGDRVLGMARNAGAAGLVTDGLVRDLSGIRDVGLPVFCAGVSPNSPVANGPGAVGVSIVLGGVAIKTGDLLLSDEDGAVIVPSQRLPEVLDRLKKIEQLENEMDRKVHDGLIVPPAVAELLKSDKTRRLS